MDRLQTLFAETVELSKSRPTAGLTELSFLHHRAPAQLVSGPPLGADVEAISRSRVHRLIQARAAAQPHLVALSSAEQGRQMTYGELAARSSRAAHFLRQPPASGAGVHQGDAVLVHLGRGFEQVVWILAILEAGACYVVVDQAWPAARKEAVAGVARANAIVTDTETLDFVATANVVHVARSAGAIDSMPHTPFDCDIADDDLAYGKWMNPFSGTARRTRRRTGSADHAQSCSRRAPRASPRASWSSTPT